MMRFLLLLSLCGWCFTRIQAQQGVAPADWYPSLSAVHQELENQIQEAKTQQTVARLAGNLFDVADAELFLVYFQLYERSSLAQRVVLEREQGRWLRERGPLKADLVTIGPTPTAEEEKVYTMGLIKVIDERTKELDARLSRLRQRHH